MKNKNSREKSLFLIYLEYIPFYLLYHLLHLLPLKAGYALSGFLFRLLLVFDRRHHTRSVQHLLHAGIAKDKAQARRLTVASYLEFSKLLVEIVKMDQLYNPAKIRVVGSQAAIDISLSQEHDNKPVIIATAHYGNWEVAGTAYAEKARIPMTSFMRPFSNPLIGKMILDHRAGDMHKLVDKREGIRPILRAISQNRITTMLIDQHAGANEGITCEFFGHPACVHMTPALLHLKTGIPIIPELTRRVPGDNFEFEILVGDPIIYTPTGNKEHDVQIVTQMCITALEKLIREEPIQWLWAPRHWLDINRRQAAEYKDWKPSPELAKIAETATRP